MRNHMSLRLWKADMELGATFPVCETYTANSLEMRKMKWKMVDCLTETDIKGVSVDVSRTHRPSPWIHTEIEKDTKNIWNLENLSLLQEIEEDQCI